MRIIFFLICTAPSWLFAQQDLPWKSFTFGEPGLSLLIPGEVSAQNNTLPPDAKAFVETYEAFYHRNSANGVVITMMHAHYNDDTEANKLGATEGTNNQWEATGSRVVILSTTENPIDSKSAVQQRGLLMNGGREYDFMDVVVVDESLIWQVIVMIPSDDKSLQPVLRKIVDSISF